MKKRLVLTVIGLALVTTAIGQQVQVQTFQSSGPAPSSGSFGPFRDNAVAFLRGKGTLMPRTSGPTAYMPLRGTIGEGDFVSVNTATNLWRGTFSPGGLYISERGNYFWDSIKITRPIPFRLSNLKATMSSSDPANSFGYTLVFTNETYSRSKWGTFYGPHGTPNLDITNGSPTQLVHELAYVGVGNSAIANNGTQWNQIVTFVNNNAPLYIFVDWELKDDAGGIIFTKRDTFTTALVTVTNSPVTLVIDHESGAKPILGFSNGVNGKAYGIDASSDFTNWLRIADIPNGTFFMDQSSVLGHKFYRAVTLEFDPGSPRGTFQSLTAGKYSQPAPFIGMPSNGEEIQ